VFNLDNRIPILIFEFTNDDDRHSMRHPPFPNRRPRSFCPRPAPKCSLKKCIQACEKRTTTMYTRLNAWTTVCSDHADERAAVQLKCVLKRQSRHQSCSKCNRPRYGRSKHCLYCLQRIRRGSREIQMLKKLANA
jgi:hypothetical protein